LKSKNVRIRIPRIKGLTGLIKKYSADNSIKLNPEHP
jgi:hypothetical protein